MQLNCSNKETELGDLADYAVRVESFSPARGRHSRGLEGNNGPPDR